MSPVLLGTVAIEPNRWSKASERPSLVPVTAWLQAVHQAGFDGLELWERHITNASPDEQAGIVGHRLPTTVLNSYVSLDEETGQARAAVADWASKLRSTGIKFNVGSDPASAGAYGERIAEWLDHLPPMCRLLCECHHGISIAEDPAVAAQILDIGGPPDRVQAIVHTHEDPDHIRARFDAYGDRITHVHVNFLNFDTIAAPRLADVTDQLTAKVDLLESLGFRGSWTIEFVEGVRTDHDDPHHLVLQAIDDLAILRSVLS